MQPSPFKTAVNFGAMSGLSCFAIFVILYKLGINPLGPASWLAVWIPPAFIVIATKRFRDYECGGFISFSMAFRAGLLTAISGGFLYALIVYIFGTLIDPALIDDFKELMLADLEQTESMIRSIVGDSVYEQSIEEMKNTTLKSIAMTDFFYKFFGGIIISLITAAILKRNRTEMI